MAKYSIIDTDTHITEPVDLWTSRAPASIKDKVPFVGTNKDGKLSWYMGAGLANPLTTIGTTSTAGHPGGMWTPPETYEEMHPGAVHAHGRLKYMDQQGIWAMVLYPNVGGLGSQNFLKLNDKGLMLSCVQIYNDWQSEWASADSRRLLATTSLPLWDVKECVKEIRRCHAMGHKGILFCGNPGSLGFPPISSPYWNPLWEVSIELGMPISFHILSGDLETDMTEKVKYAGLQAVVAAFGSQGCMINGLDMADLLLSGVLPRYPDIKFVSVESGVGWIPFLLESLDYQFRQNQMDKYSPQFDRLPSEYFKRNIYACYWFEQVAPQRLFDVIGVDNILFETDFPHPACLYGEDVWDHINRGLGGCDATTRRKILFDNAQKLFKVALPTAADEARLDKVIAEAKPFWRGAAA